jgi:hypothetical protein
MASQKQWYKLKVDINKHEDYNLMFIGVVHANVGQNVTPYYPSLGLFLYHSLHTMSS